MGRNKNVKLSEVEYFIRKVLTQKLQADLRKLKIVKEADLECCAYYHLRRFMGADNHWRILARKHSRKTGHYIDLLIFRGHSPRIALELKSLRSEISSKDRTSLVRCLTKLGVNKAYFLSTVRDGLRYSKLGRKKTPGEKYVLHERVIGLDFPDAKRKVWEGERRKYMGEMQRGKAHR